MAQNLQQAFKFLFGCWHRNLSRPFTLSGRTYEVCLSCGKEFAYARVDLAAASQSEKRKRWTGQPRCSRTVGEMTIGVGIWTELSTNERDA